MNRKSMDQTKNTKNDVGRLSVGMARSLRKHQQSVYNFCMNTGSDFYQMGMSVAPDSTPSDENLNDIVPDIIVFDSDDIPVIMGEITTSGHVSEMKRKIAVKMMSRFTQAEFFVYDYQKEIVYLYDFDKECWLSSDDYQILCPYLQVPMLPLFKLETFVNRFGKQNNVVC